MDIDHIRIIYQKLYIQNQENKLRIKLQEKNMKKILVSCLVGLMAMSVFAKFPEGMTRQETNKEKIQQALAATGLTNGEKLTLNIMLVVADMDAKKTSYADFKKAIIDFANADNNIFTTLTKKTKGTPQFEKKIKDEICKNILLIKRFQPFFEFVLKDTYMEDCIYLKYQCFYQSVLTKYYTVNKATFRKHFKYGITCTSRVGHKQDPKRAIIVLNIYKKQIIEGKLGLTKEEIDEDLRFAKLVYFPNLSKNADTWKPICVQVEMMIKANQ